MGFFSGMATAAVWMACGACLMREWWLGAVCAFVVGVLFSTFRWCIAWEMGSDEEMERAEKYY